MRRVYPRGRTARRPLNRLDGCTLPNDLTEEFLNDALRLPDEQRPDGVMVICGSAGVQPDCCELNRSSAESEAVELCQPF
jgi:hypothetical protein